MIKNLSDKAAKKILKTQTFGHLACVLQSGEPYLVPVNFLYRDEAIYVHSLPGKKLEALRENGKACLQVEEIENICRWQSVIAFGDFEEIKSINKILEIMREFAKKFERLTPVEAMIEEKWNAGGTVVFRINVNRVTGVAES